MLAIMFPYVCSLLMKEINLNDLEKIHLNIIIMFNFQFELCFKLNRTSKLSKCSKGFLGIFLF